MTHIPLHPYPSLPGSLCSLFVEPTPGIAAFPAALPVDAGRDLCPECRRVHAHLADAWIRSAARYPHLVPGGS